MIVEPGTKSEELYRRAVERMPGGVNSPVRAFNAVGGHPPFIESAVGPYLQTVDGERLIDTIASWGALILGHAESSVIGSIEQAARNGTSFGLPTGAEVELAELVNQLVPSIEMMRMVNSGTEATASAVRLARAATGRQGIVKFEGCYHGHADPFLVKAGSGAATFGEPDSPGVPASAVADTHNARFNDLDSVGRAFESAPQAAVIVEPVAGNMGVVPPRPGFLEGLREICDRNGSLLIFDEVMTGFRVGPGGAQGRFGVEPDLTCLGKVVAGGAPAAAYGGKAQLMRQVAPDGPVYQAGTLAGNPLATAAGLATLREVVASPDLYDRLEAVGALLEGSINDAIDRTGATACVQRVGAMLTVFFGVDEVWSWDQASSIDRDAFSRFFQSARRRGVMLPPSPFEALFLMRAHEGVADQLGEALALSFEEAVT